MYIVLYIYVHVCIYNVIYIYIYAAYGPGTRQYAQRGRAYIAVYIYIYIYITMCCVRVYTGVCVYVEDCKNEYIVSTYMHLCLAPSQQITFRSHSELFITISSYIHKYYIYNIIYIHHNNGLNSKISPDIQCDVVML